MKTTKEDELLTRLREQVLWERTHVLPDITEIYGEVGA